jgi:hypothetical protein
MKKKPKLLVLMGLLMLSFIAKYSTAQSPLTPTESDKWKQSITLYSWLTAQNGNAVVRGRPVNVDISLSDALDALSSLDGAAMLHYEARKERFSAIADLFYVKLANNVTTVLGDTRYESSQTIAELATSYEIGKKDTNRNRLQSVEVLGGLRYNKLGLELRGPLGVTAKGDQSWIDPFIGARFTQQLSPLWTFRTRFDIGGFSIGDASDFTWNLILGLEYRLSDLWSLDVGWRWLDYNYDKGSGNSRFEYDVLQQGPILGFRYNW